jgi:hypothetical protein
LGLAKPMGITLIMTKVKNNDQSQKWHNSDQFEMEWSMKYSEAFTIQIEINTTAGLRYLQYYPVGYRELPIRGYNEYGHIENYPSVERWDNIGGVALFTIFSGGPRQAGNWALC